MTKLYTIVHKPVMQCCTPPRYVIEVEASPPHNSLFPSLHLHSSHLCFPLAPTFHPTRNTFTSTSYSILHITAPHRQCSRHHRNTYFANHIHHLSMQLITFIHHIRVPMGALGKVLLFSTKVAFHRERVLHAMSSDPFSCLSLSVAMWM
ncbi:unnamed protein product [Hydatigera taeniaeformis]|uniref:Ovule protein n=1 Tax=Hydatigena taeniaeformis TaxID=6205 RepID=A0A0R3WWZ1_HYDTA|nr:unnamed protein product [Hydatigera taeniaeformis]